LKDVSRLEVLPSAEAIQISGDPERDEVNAILEPSGEYLGNASGQVEETKTSGAGGTPLSDVNANRQRFVSRRFVE
jgi:hypothetical protein